MGGNADAQIREAGEKAARRQFSAHGLPVKFGHGAVVRNAHDGVANVLYFRAGQPSR